MKTELTCGQALIKLLEAYNVDTVFGIPGVHTLELYRGLHNSKVKHILARHEQGAGFMADGYARISGKPGVCFTITGPGVTNIATPMGQAYSDSIPMLVISSVNERHSMGKGTGVLHETKNQRAITDPITAFSATALTPSQVPSLIARAFSIFNSERPRPVFLEIPLDVLAMPIDTDWSYTARNNAAKPAPVTSAINDAASLLRDSKKTVILAGGGAIQAGELLKLLSEKLGAAVFTTVAGKGLMGADHPLYAGSVLCMAPTWNYVNDADVVIAIGTELSETDMWQEKLPINGKLIRVDIDPVKMNDLYPADVAIVADAAETLYSLIKHIEYTLPDHSADSNRYEQTQAEILQLKADILNEQAPLQLKHKAVLDVVKKTIPVNSFIAADMTQIAYTGNYLFDVSNTRSWFHPTGYGTLGYALPAAIGAKIAKPDRPGLVLAGDGGILYTIQELATATEELSSPLVILLWNNDSLGQIRDDMVAKDIDLIGVSPVAPDFIKLAEAFGCKTALPLTLNDLEIELETAFSYAGVTLIQMNENQVTLADKR